MTKILSIFFIGLLSLTTSQEESRVRYIFGDWDGVLETSNGKLKIVFHIKKEDDGTITATLDSPDQGGFGLAFDEVKFENNVLTMKINQIQGTFTGKLNDENRKFEGTWKQGPGEAPLVMSKRMKS